MGLRTTHLGLEVDSRHILSDLEDADDDVEGMGCTYTAACNFDPTAVEDDGSCDLSCICGEGLIWDGATQTCAIQCIGDLDFDQSVSTTDLLYFLSAYGLNAIDLAGIFAEKPISWDAHLNFGKNAK